MIILFYILWGITLIHTLYFFFTGLIGFLKKDKPINRYEPKTKFCILIPARNEEAVIGPLIDSIKEVDYPKDLYDIQVLVNNSTDNTEKIALHKKANVHKPSRETHSKGEVLKDAIEAFKDFKYDAYIIVDADNILDKDFLKEMNNVYLEGYKIAQGERRSKNAGASWISTSYSIFYHIQNTFYNRAHTKMGLSSSLNGTGFMVDKRFLEENFNTSTMTEDIEFSIIANLKKEKIAYVKNAITYDEQPLSFKVSWTQRIRWSVGTKQCIKKYSKDLFKEACKGNFDCLDKILFVTTIYIQVLSSILSVVHIILTLTGNTIFPIVTYSLMINVLISLGGYIGTVIIYTLLIKYYENDILKNSAGIILFNVFIFSWIFINIISIFKKDVTWKPIKHGCESK